MIRCVDVRKTYRSGGRSVEALRGLSAEIPGGGFDAIMGRSGSGKSTLMHLLGALDKPDSGTIEVAGTRIDMLSEKDATQYRRRGIGIVFQSYNLVPTMTAAENVQLPGLLGGDDAAHLRSRSMELLDRLGLADRATHRPEALSGGEQQRVAIARALLYKPPVLLADEPTGNLDSRSAALVWKLLREIAAEQDITVLMVTHEPEAASYCRRIFVVGDGVIRGVIDAQAEGGLDAGGVATRAQRLLGEAE
ncbi:ABC transporter ATP-binding protein [Nodularia spumigena]|jgi:putative ABC transport system ATP-binding protein|uniref:ABC transporter ATP-binding protein n=1 Tax=Nodularia spumigena TaxID=70799 RepID=UPI002B1F2C5A|nr:ABC transporter ATP-binding protein [Nodularia spumigena]MEA5611815.1 ABC transporter ATP-binding protein [Nodularia spumigena UHCC 0040]